MRIFTTGGRLRASGLPLRLALTGFLLFVTIGYASNLAILVWKTHGTPTGIARYYRGYVPPPGSLEDMAEPKELHELLENTHFHVYIVPTVLLILTHVFFMMDVRERTRVAVTVLAFGSALADLAGPWLVRYGGAGFAWWKLVSAAVYHATLFFLVGACFWGAWGARLEPEGARPPAAPDGIES